MPKIDLDTIPQTNTTGYPAPYDAPVQGRWYRRLARVTGVSDFAASHVVLKPGAWSSQRHWHDGEDEMLVMIAGEAVLIEDDGRGFDPSAVVGDPMGLQIMRERAQGIGGQLEVSSAPGRGTTVAVTWHSGSQAERDV